MRIVVVCSFVAIILTFLESRGKIKWGMLYGFIIVTFLGCIHYNYGNDYVSYFEWFKNATRAELTLEDLIDGSYEWEPGWVILNHAFKGFGFFSLVAFINIVMNVIYYRIIRKYVEKKWWPLAVSIYLLSSSLYILNFSMMRQGLAVAVFLAAWPIISNGKLLKSLLLVLICASFHKSALILLPFIFVGKLNKVNGNVISFVIAGLLIALYLSTSLAPDLYSALTTWDYFYASDSVSYYEQYENLDRTFRLGFVINLIPFLVGEWLLLSKKCKPEDKGLIVLCLMGYVVGPFGDVLTMLLRFSYYFIAYQVIAIPKMYSMVSNSYLKAFLIGLFCVVLLYSYFGFFSDPAWVKAYSVFHTIFEAI